MSTFTLEANGRAIACICAETRDIAEQKVDDPWFRDGLLGLDQEGPPVWNGEAELRLRSATPNEIATVQEEIGARRAAGELLDEEDAVIFLVPEHARTAADHQLILASRVEHTPVYTEAGERIGHIDDLSIGRQDGQVVYAIMSFGGFLGIGAHFHPIPWSMLEYDPERGGYVVPLDKSVLANAPQYEAAELMELGGPRQDVYRKHILEYYGQYAAPPI